jgi:hypothetical protein
MKRISIRDRTIHERCLQAASSQRERRVELGGVVMFAHVRGAESSCVAAKYWFVVTDSISI